MVSILKRLDEVGFEQTRRALAALALSFFISIYLILSLNAPPAMGPRVPGAVGLLPGRVPVAERRVVLGALVRLRHRLVRGDGGDPGAGDERLDDAAGDLRRPARPGGRGPVRQEDGRAYDLQEPWRQRYGWTSSASRACARRVTRAAASLPSLILWALGPKEGQGGMLLAAVGIATLLSVAAGLRGLVQLRSWGWMLVTGAGATLWLLGASGSATALATMFPTSWYQDFGYISTGANAPGLRAAAAGDAVDAGGAAVRASRAALPARSLVDSSGPSPVSGRGQTFREATLVCLSSREATTPWPLTSPSPRSSSRWS